MGRLSTTGVPPYKLSVVLGVAASLLASVTFAQSNSPARFRTPATQERIVSPPGQLQASRLEQSRRQVLAALSTVETELSKQQQINLKECQKLLRWQELSTEVTHDSPQLARLQELSHVFYGSALVFEQPSVVQLRKALAEYIQAARLNQLSNFGATYRWHYDRLSQQLASDQNARDDDILRRHVAWMHWLEETPEIAQQVRQQATYSNVVVAVRKDLLKPYLEKLNQEVKETRFANHVIVGAMVSGNVHANGRSWPQLDFEDRIPKLRIHYTGTSLAPNSRAVSGPVTVRNRGVTAIEATTEVHWNGRQLVASPTVARCSTKITQLSIAVNRAPLIPLFSGGLVNGVIQNVAARRASEQRAQAEWESSQIIQRNVTTRMDSQVAKFVATANGYFDEHFAKPAARAGIEPVVYLESDQDFVTVGLAQFDAAQMAADRPAAWRPMQGDAIVGIHQSALTAFTQRLCGGALWRDKDFFDLQRFVMGIRSEELKIGTHPRWALQLDWLQPFSMHIDRHGVEFTIRAQSITYNEKTLTCPIRITAKYKLQPSDTTLHCLRQGDVEVACLAGAEGSEAVRRRVAQFVKQKFSGFFEKRVYLDGISLPAGQRWDSMTTVYVREVQTSAGWLYLAVDHKNSSATRLVQQKPTNSEKE